MDLGNLRRRLDHWRDRLSHLRIDGEHPTEAAMRAVAEELIEEIEHDVADIEAADRWIPTSERLPGDGDRRGGLNADVLFVYEGEVFPGWFTGYSFIWMESGGEQYVVPPKDVTHWKLLPEPPKGEHGPG